MPLYVLQGDALQACKGLPPQAFDLIYIDPPFNTGKVQHLAAGHCEDTYEDFESFLRPVLVALVDCLSPEGSLFVHLDYREVHYAKVWLDQIIGRAAFQGEIIWHFETGGLSKSKWSNKHQTILWYSRAKTPYFDFDAVPTTSRKAPKEGYTGDKKWTSVWNINVSTTDPERVGYPSQKPLFLLETLVRVHTKPHAMCLDVFAGSGTLGAACLANDRNAVLVDCNPEAIAVMKKRFGAHAVFETGGAEC